METVGVLGKPLAASQPPIEDAAAVDLAALYDAYAGPLFRYLLTMLGEPEDTADALQDVFLGILRRPRGRRIENLQAYLFRAARNQALMILRSRKHRRQEMPDGAFSWVDVQACEPHLRELAIDLQRAVCQLPLAQREVIVLRLGEGLTFQKIASILSIRPNTAASRYRLALARLRALLGGGDEHA